MAFPFGGHPSLARYLAWAREKGGCTVDFGVMTDDAGRPFSIIKITAPSGKFVVLVNMDQKEHLVPTSIARLDRRLELQSPFFSLSDDHS
jgi:hypothetical protein